MNDSLAIARYWRGRWAHANAENVNTRLALVDARRALVVEREGTQALREQLDIAVATGKRLMQERDELREQRDKLNRYARLLEDECAKMREERDAAQERAAALQQRCDALGLGMDEMMKERTAMYEAAKGRTLGDPLPDYIARLEKRVETLRDERVKMRDERDRAHEAHTLELHVARENQRYVLANLSQIRLSLRAIARRPA